MKLWSGRWRRRRTTAATPTPTDVEARHVEAAARQERQAVSPEQFDRPPVYVLGRS